MNGPIFTTLSCSNPDLIASGSTFINNNKEQIISSAEDEVEFKHYCGDLFDELKEISNYHPNDRFHLNVFDYLDIHNCVEWELILDNGEFEQLSSKPKYLLSGKKTVEVDSTIKEEFENKIYKFLEKYPPHTLLPKGENNDSDGAPQYHDGDMSVYLTFKWKNKKYEISAKNEFGYLVETKYELRKDNGTEGGVIQVGFL
jgi:hypothetical protein